jgi:hypothetical protein
MGEAGAGKRARTAMERRRPPWRDPGSRRLAERTRQETDGGDARHRAQNRHDELRPRRFLDLIKTQRVVKRPYCRLVRSRNHDAKRANDDEHADSNRDFEHRIAPYESQRHRISEETRSHGEPAVDRGNSSIAANSASLVNSIRP